MEKGTKGGGEDWGHKWPEILGRHGTAFFGKNGPFYPPARTNALEERLQTWLVDSRGCPPEIRGLVEGGKRGVRSNFSGQNCPEKKSSSGYCYNAAAAMGGACEEAGAAGCPSVSSSLILPQPPLPPQQQPQRRPSLQCWGRNISGISSPLLVSGWCLASRRETRSVDLES